MTNTDKTVSTEELQQWAEKRADDAGRLARELLPYRLASRTQEPAPVVTDEMVESIAQDMEVRNLIEQAGRGFMTGSIGDTQEPVWAAKIIKIIFYKLTAALTKQEGSATISVEFECPINQPGCTKNCGSYGCGN